MQYEWAEDDFALPYGVSPLGLSAPGDNKNYVMYHGTTRENATLILKNGFLQSAGGMLGRGVYLSRDLQKASRYPLRHPESDKVVIKVRVNVGKVIAINHQKHPYRETWHYQGYDTAWVPPNCGMVKSGLEEDCVWDPNRIQILNTINPRPVQGGCGAWGYKCDTETKMQYEWAEDDFVLPDGVVPLGLSAPGDNKKYVMYHGTTKKSANLILAKGFRQSEDGMLGRGVYLSRDLQKASCYPIDHPVSDKVVIKVKVNVGKVTAINRQYHPMQTTWHDHGYDTAWVPPNCGMVKSGLEEDCVWDPDRIEILKTINPRPVKPSSGHGARGYNDTETKMQYEWAEDDFVLPDGVVPLGLSAPGDNKKYVMYHGTTKKSANLILAKGFRQSEDGMLGRGVYLSRDLQKASCYPIDHPVSDKVVIKVKVNVGKVTAINRQYHPMQKTWHDHGYDTAWVPPNCGMVKSGLEEDCVWDPDRIEILKTINPLPPAHRNTAPEPPCDNQNYVMYHGTTRGNATLILQNGFHQSRGGLLGRGVYLSRDLQKASCYPLHHPEYDKVVITVGVNVGRVIVINHQKHPMQKIWHDHGYDTAWVPPNCGMVKSSLEVDCVWDPNQIQILNTINPRPVQGGYGARGYM
ncbi:uncharacterized protein LOC141781535 [Sebastes fasciatus]|uniref:uncharacterized protein LOC141781535 n=1 Tax=Sebastes fasciatus TaxID=394691 RepID=UPI003D9E6352